MHCVWQNKPPITVQIYAAVTSCGLIMTCLNSVSSLFIEYPYSSNSLVLQHSLTDRETTGLIPGNIIPPFNVKASTHRKGGHMFNPWQCHTKDV